MNGWSYRLSPRLVLRTRLPERPETGERVLLVQSGEAFPPGHPSTRLCLDLLREALAARPVQRLLDVGCGAGVLSLAAAALGVPRVVAVDLALGSGPGHPGERPGKRSGRVDPGGAGLHRRPRGPI